jgi:hypothetical protein
MVDNLVKKARVRKLSASHQMAEIGSVRVSQGNRKND